MSTDTRKQTKTRDRCSGGSNLGGGRPDIVGVVVERGEESMSRRGRGSRVMGSTHVCGSVSGVVPHVVHQGGEVLQAVRDVVREEQDAHRLRTYTQSSISPEGYTRKGVLFYRVRVLLTELARKKIKLLIRHSRYHKGGY